MLLSISWLVDPPCHVWRGEDDHAVLQAEEVLHALQVDGLAGFGLDVEVGGDDGGGTGGGEAGGGDNHIIINIFSI